MLRFPYIRWKKSGVYALLYNLPFPRGFEGVPKPSNDISVKGYRSARFLGIVYG